MRRDSYRRIDLVVLLSGFVLASSSSLYGESQPSLEKNTDPVVEQLRGLPTPLPAGFTGIPRPLPPEEQRRHQTYEQLHALGSDSIPSLARALRDPDLSMRRNVTLVLGVLAGGWWQFTAGPSKIDISAALPELIIVLRDNDSLVRAWAAQDLGDMGPTAAGAVPALIELLGRDRDARIGVCIALRDIGPAAKSALPALKPLLSDPDAGIRKMASRATAVIQGSSVYPGG
jgi:HEAT repeat protein